MQNPAALSLDGLPNGSPGEAFTPTPGTVY